MHRLILLLSLALAACALSPRPLEPRAFSSGETLAIIGVSVIPMTEDSRLVPDQTVLVREGRVAAIGPRHQIRVPRNARRIDARGQYLLPGLADMHVHLEHLENPDVLKLFVANGVTTVRSMDGRPFILRWRDQVRDGSLIGPRIVTAGPIIDGSPPARDDNLSIADAAAARAAVADQRARGYDFIKLYTNLSADAFGGAVAEARQGGLPIAGHLPRKVPLEDALPLFWSIEHLGDFAGIVAADGSTIPGWARRALAAPLDQARLAALARRLADAGTWIVPTNIQQDRFLAPASEMQRWLEEPAIRSLPPSVLAEWRGASERFSARLDAGDWALLERARRNRLAMVRVFHEHGVKLAIGTDTPNPFVAMGASVHLELANFVAAGLSPWEALRTATVAPAQMLDLQAEQGTIEIGKRADLLLLAENPLEEIGRTARPIGLVLRGRWLPEKELAALARSLTPVRNRP